MKRTPLKKNQTPLKKTPLKREGDQKGLKTSPLKKTGFKSKREKREPDMRYFFLEIWDEREDENGFCYCFETGKPMHRSKYRLLSTVYDHVLEKSNYEQYKFEKWNIVIILPEIHYQKGDNLDFVPKLKALRNSLLEKHKKEEL